jgi:hypothetical protein
LDGVGLVRMLHKVEPFGELGKGDLFGQGHRYEGWYSLRRVLEK